MIKSIMKRDGRVVLYDESKIASAILKALEAAREGDASVAAQVANSVKTCAATARRRLNKFRTRWSRS